MKETNGNPLFQPRDLNGHAHLVNGIAPPRPGPTIQVVQVGARELVVGVICSPSVWGVVTHWDEYAGRKGRTQRCTLDKTESCEGCEKELPSRWKGYIHFFDLVAKKEAYLEITPKAFDLLCAQAPHKKPLRGLKITAKRAGKSAQSRLQIELALYAGEDVDQLPKARDPEPVLETLWAWRR